MESIVARCDHSVNVNKYYFFIHSSQLEDKLKEKVDASLKDKIDLSGELDVFHS